jgi:hypothetical protein
MRSLLTSLILLTLAGCGHKQTELMIYGGQKVHWAKARLPVPVYTSCSDHVKASLDRAVARINQVAGCTVFAPVGEAIYAPPNTVEVVCYNEMEEPEGLCEFNTNPDGSIKNAKVTIPCYTPFDETQDLIATHELLHTLGFDHDTDLGTILYGSVVGAANNFSDEDTKILREVYCGKASHEVF